MHVDASFGIARVKKNVVLVVKLASQTPPLFCPSSLGAAVYLKAPSPPSSVLARKTRDAFRGDRLTLIPRTQRKLCDSSRQIDIKRDKKKLHEN